MIDGASHYGGTATRIVLPGETAISLSTLTCSV